jgi:predicted TIM-barrel fold metal-dependent hydrolase
VRWEDVRPAFYDPRARIEDMAADGLVGTVLYPNVLLDLCNNQITLAPDVYEPVIQVYNDFLSDFCAHDLSCLVGVGLLPMHDVEAGLQELRRMARLPGIRGAMLPIQPLAGDWCDRKYEPIFATAAEMGLVLSIHAGKPRWLPRRSELPKVPGGNATYLHVGPLSTMEAFTQLMWAGYFDRHPSLKMVCVEGGIGWLAWWKWRALDVCRRHGDWLGIRSSSPEQWFGRNLHFTFETDPVGIQTRREVGVEALMWASDYPHTATTWPNSKDSLARELAGVPEAERALITGGNARRVYGLA